MVLLVCLAFVYAAALILGVALDVDGALPVAIVVAVVLGAQSLCLDWGLAGTPRSNVRGATRQ